MSGSVTIEHTHGTPGGGEGCGTETSPGGVEVTASSGDFALSLFNESYKSFNEVAFYPDETWTGIQRLEYILAPDSVAFGDTIDLRGPGFMLRASLPWLGTEFDLLNIYLAVRSDGGSPMYAVWSKKAQDLWDGFTAATGTVSVSSRSPCPYRIEIEIHYRFTRGSFDVEWVVSAVLDWNAVTEDFGDCESCSGCSGDVGEGV